MRHTIFLWSWESPFSSMGFKLPICKMKWLSEISSISVFWDSLFSEAIWDVSHYVLLYVFPSVIKTDRSPCFSFWPKSFFCSPCWLSAPVAPCSTVWLTTFSLFSSMSSKPFLAEWVRELGRASKGAKRLSFCLNIYYFPNTINSPHLAFTEWVSMETGGYIVHNDDYEVSWHELNTHPPCFKAQTKLVTMDSVSN